MKAETPACVRAAKYPSNDPSRCAQRHRFRMANAQNVNVVDRGFYDDRQSGVKIKRSPHPAVTTVILSKSFNFCSEGIPSGKDASKDDLIKKSLCLSAKGGQAHHD
jgi:hypothetical protein